MPDFFEKIKAFLMAVSGLDIVPIFMEKFAIGSGFHNIWWNILVWI